MYSVDDHKREPRTEIRKQGAEKSNSSVQDKDTQA